MPETARIGRRIAIFVGLGPPLGMLTVLLWELARGTPLPSLEGVLTSVLVAYPLGALPSLAAGLADAFLATRVPGPHRVVLTGIAGGLAGAGFAVVLGASDLGPGFVPWVGLLATVPAVICAVLAGMGPAVPAAASK